MESEEIKNEQTPVEEVPSQPAATKKVVRKVVKKKVKKPNPVVTFLNKFFHFQERGGSLGAEISGGITSFVIAFVALIYNTNLMYQYYGGGGADTYIAGTYLASAIVMFLGSLAIGIIANLPLVQSVNIGTSTVLITTLAANAGLSYANVMLVTFISALIYLALVVSPLYKHVLKAIPDGVRKGLPVAVGLLVMITALKNAGFINAAGGLKGASDFILVLDKWYFWVAIIGLILFLVFKVFGNKKAFTKAFWIMVACMWLGGVIFFMDVFVGGETAGTIVYGRLNIIVETDGATPYTLALGLSEISKNFGTLFTEGFDFSALAANGGNAFLVIVEGVLTYLIMGLYGNVGYTRGALECGNLIGEDGEIVGERKAYIVAAASNVVAPILGAAPTSVGAESTIQTEDGAKTGLSSIVASIGFLIAIFNWIFLAIVATSTNAVGMWIEASETKLQAYVQDVSVFADMIMVIAGACMLKSVKNLNFKEIDEIAPFAALVAGAIFFQNIALGAALGTVIWAIIKLLKREWKSFTIASIVSSSLMLVLLAVELI